MKKLFLSAAAILAVCLTLTGCFGMYGPQPTIPPQKEFGSETDMAAAVAGIKADASLADVENLRGLTGYYVPQALSENMKLSNVKISTEAVILLYADGPVTEDTADNQFTFGWYRNENADTFMSDRAQLLMNAGFTYDTITAGGNTYLHSIAKVNKPVTAPPGSTAVATPTPELTPYAQALYWVQDGAAFVAIVPLGFSNDDIGKYCQVQKAELVQ
jgi:predicted small lipoprotein YifL